jgi:hypothetical protein
VRSEGVHLARKPRDSMNLPRLPTMDFDTNPVAGPALPVTIVSPGKWKMEGATHIPGTHDTIRSPLHLVKRNEIEQSLAQSLHSSLESNLSRNLSKRPI